MSSAQQVMDEALAALLSQEAAAKRALAHEKLEERSATVAAALLADAAKTASRDHLAADSKKKALLKEVVESTLPAYAKVVNEWASGASTIDASLRTAFEKAARVVGSAPPVTAASASAACSAESKFADSGLGLCGVTSSGTDAMGTVGNAFGKSKSLGAGSNGGGACGSDTITLPMQLAQTRTAYTALLLACDSVAGSLQALHQSSTAAGAATARAAEADGTLAAARARVEMSAAGNLERLSALENTSATIAALKKKSAEADEDMGASAVRVHELSTAIMPRLYEQLKSIQAAATPAAEEAHAAAEKAAAELAAATATATAAESAAAPLRARLVALRSGATSATNSAASARARAADARSAAAASEASIRASTASMRSMLVTLSSALGKAHKTSDVHGWRECGVGLRELKAFLAAAGSEEPGAAAAAIAPLAEFLEHVRARSVSLKALAPALPAAEAAAAASLSEAEAVLASVDAGAVAAAKRSAAAKQRLIEVYERDRLVSVDTDGALHQSIGGNGGERLCCTSGDCGHCAELLASDEALVDEAVTIARTLLRDAPESATAVAAVDACTTTGENKVSTAAVAALEPAFASLIAGLGPHFFDIEETGTAIVPIGLLATEGIMAPFLAAVRRAQRQPASGALITQSIAKSANREVGPSLSRLAAAVLERLLRSRAAAAEAGALATAAADVAAAAGLSAPAELAQCPAQFFWENDGTLAAEMERLGLPAGAARALPSLRASAGVGTTSTAAANAAAAMAAAATTQDGATFEGAAVEAFQALTALPMALRGLGEGDGAASLAAAASAATSALNRHPAGGRTAAGKAAMREVDNTSSLAARRCEEARSAERDAADAVRRMLHAHDVVATRARDAGRAPPTLPLAAKTCTLVPVPIGHSAGSDNGDKFAIVEPVGHTNARHSNPILTASEVPCVARGIPQRSHNDCVAPVMNVQFTANAAAAAASTEAAASSSITRVDAVSLTAATMMASSAAQPAFRVVTALKAAATPAAMARPQDAPVDLVATVSRPSAAHAVDGATRGGRRRIG